MEFILAKQEHLEMIYDLIQNTINEVYPKYYPQKVVSFFCQHHKKENIFVDIEKGNVKVLLMDGYVVGTGSFADNHIIRVFVSPKHQGQGYGRLIMEELESEIMQNHGEAYLDSSLPAAEVYEHLGYKTICHKSFKVDKDTVLVYGIMKKDCIYHQSELNKEQ